MKVWEEEVEELRIAIDARLYDESGVGRYIRNLLSELQILDRENEYFILLLKKRYLSLNFDNELFKKVLADIKWYGFAEQLKMPSLLEGLGVNLVHFPHFNVPLGFKENFVVTIHDLIHQHFQMRRATIHDPLTYKIKQLGYTTIFNNAVSKAKRIIVPSNYVKELLINKGIDSNKVIVTYEAVEDSLFKRANKLSQTRINSVLKKFKIKNPYIFYVGNAHPHKNVEGLIKAYLDLKEKDASLSLVLSGYDHYFWQRLVKEFKYQGIIYTGYVSDEDLVCLYKAASCFVMPSLEEGFGIPLLEAMACSCPVVSSNVGSLKEVGGDAALYFDPREISDMTNKIVKVLNDKKLRDNLIEKGKQRIKLFSWKKLAQETLGVYQKCGLH